MHSFINLIILFFHIFAIGGLTLVALRIGKEALVAWIALLGVVANLFVLKQVNLVGLNVTSTDSLIVGLILGLNLIQEYFGKKEAKKTIWITFFITGSYLLLSQFHLRYIPNAMDTTQEHFKAILQPMPRIVIASLATFLIVQFVDVSFFSFLRNKTAGRFFISRALASLILSQTLDTILFSFLGLYGYVESVLDIMFLSLLIKLLVILFSSPFIALSKKVFPSYATV